MENKSDWRVRVLDATSVAAPLVALVMLLFYKTTLNQFFFWVMALFLALQIHDGVLRYKIPSVLKRALQNSYIVLSIVLFCTVIYMGYSNLHQPH